MKITRLKNFALIVGGLTLHATAWGEQETVTFQDCKACPEMTVVPSGEVTIGSYVDEAYRRKGERSKQKVKIRNPFAMARTEITLAQYRVFMRDSNHTPEDMVYKGETYKGCNYYDGQGYGYVQNHSWENPGYPQREQEPVVCVSWSDARAYAKWLSGKTGRDYRVPSTVEFEYALRAGAQTPWPWGTDPDEACTFANVGDQTFSLSYPKRSRFACDDGYLFLARVGKFQANAFGLHDMIGNAWEWTNDCWHDDLSKAPLDGSSWQGEQQGDCTARTPKGGSWISGPGWSRAAVRSKDGQHYRSFMLGFRVAARTNKK